jgi:hypothetical protein
VPDPQPVDEVSRPAAFTLMAPGWYPPEHAITQAYGFCFTEHGSVALVQTHDGFPPESSFGSEPELLSAFLLLVGIATLTFLAAPARRASAADR